MKTPESLVTTIIPTYRRPVMLRRAIESTIRQNIPGSKICVYDNASNDETEEVVREFSSYGNLEYYRHSENIGGLANFQFGLSRVETPFFSFLSDDDYLLPNFYSRALDTLSKCSASMLWAGATLNVDESGNIWDARLLRWPREGIFSPPEGFFAMTSGMAPTWTGILFRREIIDRIGLLDPSILGPSDLEYCLRAAARFSYYVEKHPSAVFTLNSQSFSATQPLGSFWPGWLSMFEKIENDEELNETFRCSALEALHQDAVRMLFRRGANALAAGRYDFVHDAANALENDCHLHGRPKLLRALSSVCRKSRLAQHIYTSAYRLAERRIIHSRAELQAMYGHLLRSY